MPPSTHTRLLHVEFGDGVGVGCRQQALELAFRCGERGLEVLPPR